MLHSITNRDRLTCALCRRRSSVWACHVSCCGMLIAPSSEGFPLWLIFVTALNGKLPRLFGITHGQGLRFSDGAWRVKSIARLLDGPGPARVKRGASPLTSTVRTPPTLRTSLYKYLTMAPANSSQRYRYSCLSSCAINIDGKGQGVLNGVSFR